MATGLQMKTLGEAIAAHYVVGMSKTVMGFARVVGSGEVREGIELLREAVTQLEHRDILLSASLIYGLLAEALALVGEWAEAMRYVDKAFARCAAGDRVGEIQAYRALGSVLVRNPSVRIEEVRACYGKALERARVQQRPREEAVTLLSQGEVLRQAGDEAGARDALGRAATLFDGMSMAWYAARARTLAS
jgi:tetratricopeptide (TPR) repeat protein